MKILFISIAWPAPGQINLYTDLMSEFVANGHEVLVVGTQHNDRDHKRQYSEENGMRVVRVFSGKIRKTSYLRKFTSLLTLGNKIERAVKAYFGSENIELIIAPTPPITLSLAHRRLKRHFAARFYLLLKDIWPQGSVDLGVFRRYSVPWLFFRSHEKRIYKLADHIGCMSPLGVKYILEKNAFVSREKIEVCPNSILPRAEETTDRALSIRDKYAIPRDACVFIFSGNLGVGHGLHFLVEAIEALKDYPDAYFIIGGAGTKLSYMEKQFELLKPSNALLYSWLPREDFEQIMQTSDVGLILLYKYTSPQFPSRILSYLDHSKPVLCAVNAETDMGAIVEETDCGRSVLHGDTEGFISAVKFFAENPERRLLMGKNGHKLLLDRYTVRESYNIIMKHFQDGKKES